MPQNVQISDDLLTALEEGGGLAPRTLKDRAKSYEDFKNFVKSEGHDINQLMAEGGDDGKKVLGKTFGRYFFTMRIKSNTGEELWPKKGYAEKVRSHIKMSISEEFQVDITDTKVFPEAAKNWKAFCEQLVKEGRSETEHHCEVDPATMEAINNLLVAVMEALEARGTDQYEEKLSKIPAEHHHSIHKLLQWGAMMQLILFEVRRGGEGIHELKKSDFVVFRDQMKKFDYIKHCKTEKDKNHQDGTNSSLYGCIPFLDFADNFNPGKLFHFYMKFVPDKATKAGVEGGFLFPRARKVSTKFALHDPQVLTFYEPNMGGKSWTKSLNIF